MGWLTGWTYRKAITVTNASANYQTKMLIGESSGASGEEVDCGGHCRTDFGDLRFTGADGTTLLDYWIESITGTTPNQLATIWVENNATPDTTLYMYYGKADATSLSNGANTFIQFDDFEWGNDGDDIDTSGGSITWSKSVSGSNTAKIDASQHYGGTRSLRLHRVDASPYAYFTQVAGTGYAIRFRFRKEGSAKGYLYQGDGTTVILAPAVDELENIRTYNGSSYDDTGYDTTNDTWELFELTDYDWTNKTIDLWFNGSKIVDDADVSWANANYADEIRFGHLNPGTGDLWVDDVIVRKWAATEPSFSWGSEESASQTIILSGIAQAIALGSPALLQGATIQPSGIAQATALGTPTVIKLLQIIAPSGIDQPTSLGTPALKYAQTIYPSSIEVIIAIGEPSVCMYGIIKPSGIAQVVAIGTPTLLKYVWHVILDGQYATETPRTNRACVIGRDQYGNPVYGTAVDSIELGLVGERLDFQQELAIPTDALAEDMAEAILAKMRLSGKMGVILIPPNCGQELFDVVQITDSQGNQSAVKFRVVGIRFEYNPRQARYQHRLILGAP